MPDITLSKRGPKSNEAAKAPEMTIGDYGARSRRRQVSR
jgi:hypothetical protein